MSRSSAFSATAPTSTSAGDREIAPPPALAPWVDCFWTRSPAPEPVSDDRAAAPPPHVVRPDGCVDVLLLRRGAHDAAFVVGPMTRPEAITDAAALDVVAVRFRPGGASAFFAAPLHEWQDRDVPLADA